MKYQSTYKWARRDEDSEARDVREKEMREWSQSQE